MMQIAVSEDVSQEPNLVFSFTTRLLLPPTKIVKDLGINIKPERFLVGDCHIEVYAVVRPGETVSGAVFASRMARCPKGPFAPEWVPSLIATGEQCRGIGSLRDAILLSSGVHPFKDEPVGMLGVQFKCECGGPVPVVKDINASFDHNCLALRLAEHRSLFH